MAGRKGELRWRRGRGGSRLPIRFGEQEEEEEEEEGQLAEGKWGGGHRCSLYLAAGHQCSSPAPEPTNQLRYGSLLRVIARKWQRITQTQLTLFLSGHN